jgi:hypothetical protein
VDWRELGLRNTSQTSTASHFYKTMGGPLVYRPTAAEQNRWGRSARRGGPIVGVTREERERGMGVIRKAGDQLLERLVPKMSASAAECVFVKCWCENIGSGLVVWIGKCCYGGTGCTTCRVPGPNC